MSQMNAMQEIFPLGAGRSPDVRARVVEHSLVTSFRSSNPPTVWRMDLEKNHSFAVAIQKKEQDWELGVMSPKGDFTVVARFHERADVDAAMSEVESAMFSNPNSTGIKVWRLSAMTAAMVRVARGDTAVAVPALGPADEIGKLAAAPQTFKSNLIESRRPAAEREAEQAAKEPRSPVAPAALAQLATSPS